MTDIQIEPDIVVEGCNNWVVVENDKPNAAVVPTNTNTKSPYLDPTRSSMKNTPAITTMATSSSSGGGGLSELSKQLRLLQNQNQNQSLEIDKLQRQLRILSELQNVNVNDIRSALALACQAEAYGELQTRITSLRAELEVVQLTAATTKSSSSIPAAALAGNMPSPEEVQNQQMMAQLELRIGELEEIDEQRREEIQQLYTQLQNQQAGSSLLQAKCDQLQNENEQLQLQLQQQKQQQQETQKKLNEVQANEIRAVAVVKDNSQHNANVEIQKLLAAHVAAMAQVRESETCANVATEKFKLCEQQRDTVEKELTLRNVQYKARYLVQEENINDLRQQLISLYTAYDFIKEEKDRDDITRNQLQALLGHADAEVARQVDEIDHAQSQRGSYISSSMSPPTTPSSSLSYNNPKKSPYSRESAAPTIHVVPPESPMPMMDRSSSSSASSSLLLQNQPLQESAPIMSGDLLIKDTRGMIKKWRKRHVKLYATVSHFHLDVEEEKGYAIQIGISSVEIYTKYPNGILIHMGKRSGLSLILAATNDKDFQDWMTVLTYATTGTDYNDIVDDENNNNNTNSNSNEFMSVVRSSSPIPTKSSPQYDYDRYNDMYPPEQRGHEPLPSTLLHDQQASDLELALQLSEREFQLSQQHHLS